MSNASEHTLRNGKHASIKKADRTRQLLLDSALRIISRKGYSSATVDEIVRDAGVSKGLAYYHFKSKADMATDILGNGLDSIIERFEGLAGSAPDAAAALSGMLELFSSELYHNREFARFLMTELWRSGRAWSAEMSQKTQKLVDIVAAQLQRGQDEGSIRAGNDPMFGAVSVIGMVLTDALYYAGVEGEALLDEQGFVERIRTLARQALC